MLELLQTAISHHQAGRLDQAEPLYRQILAHEPAQADALHLLGVVHHQRGQHAVALDLITRAVALQPRQASYYSNLAETCRALGDLEKAEAHCREAIRLDSNSAEAHNNLGMALRQAGRSEEAIEAFESAIERRPTWPQPFVNLGGLLRELGRTLEAAAIYREGVRVCGDAPLLRNDLGELSLELGRAEDAVLHCQEAVRLRPDQPQAQLNLGDALAAVGRVDEAHARYREAIRLAPASAAPYARLGRLAQALGLRDEALNWFTEAAQRDPTDPGVGCQIAAVLHELDRADDAVARLREVIRTNPSHHRAHNSLGYLLQDQGDVLAAKAAYSEAIRLKPDHPDARLNLGLLLLETGEKEQAVASFREALRLDPDHPESLSALALALRDRLPEAETAACERVLTRGRAPAGRLAVLRYGLAQVMDGRGLYDRAAELASRGNAYFRDESMRLKHAYDPGEHHAYVDQILRAYSPEHFERVRGWGSETETPVFILGLPRSGTSLVEQILASHPQVFGAGELDYLRSAYRSLPQRVGRRAPGVECIDGLTPAVVEALAGEYLEAVGRLAPMAERIVDKMPDNYLMLGLIATLFPKARVIHTRRNVLDVGLSCWLTHFKHIRWACDLEHIGLRILEYQRLMEHWRRVLPLNLLEIDYEEVVSDLEPAARKLVAWCGLEWDPACLEFHQTRRTVRTASMTQVREPIYRRSLERWKHYRTALAPLLKVLAPDEIR